MSAARDRRRTTALLHGGYFCATGIWPLLHMRSFEAVTGPKPGQRWLVRTVGALTTCIGGALLSAARRPDGVPPDLRGLAAAAAVAFAATDVVYVARRRIAPVYLADAAAQALFLGAWALAARSEEQVRD